MQTIGERLEDARKKKGISIREAAEATKIRGDYLQKFETNQFDIGLTEIYTRGFLRNYANYLKLPADRILNDYSALGRGNLRPRQPNREVYGRMDISVATAGEASDRAAPPEGAPVTEPSPQRPAQPHFPRSSGSSLPGGLDPAVVFKYVKWAGIVIVCILVLLILKAMFSTTPSPTTTRPSAGMSAAQFAPTERTITLIALNPVRVTVVKKNADESHGELLWEGNLSRNEVKKIPHLSAVYVTASAAENLEFEVDGGKRWVMSTALKDSNGKLATGRQTGQIPAP